MVNAAQLEHVVGVKNVVRRTCTQAYLCHCCDSHPHRCQSHQATPCRISVDVTITHKKLQELMSLQHVVILLRSVMTSSPPLRYLRTLAGCLTAEALLSLDTAVLVT
eukprot:385950-Amphidinium_carterae.1